MMGPQEEEDISVRSERLGTYKLSLNNYTRIYPINDNNYIEMDNAHFCAQ